MVPWPTPLFIDRQLIESDSSCPGEEMCGVPEIAVEQGQSNSIALFRQNTKSKYQHRVVIVAALIIDSMAYMTIVALFEIEDACAFPDGVRGLRFFDGLGS